MVWWHRDSVVVTLPLPLEVPAQGLSQWHNTTYKKMVVHVMLQTVIFFVFGTTFVFHIRGMQASLPT